MLPAFRRWETTARRPFLSIFILFFCFLFLFFEMNKPSASYEGHRSGAFGQVVVIFQDTGGRKIQFMGANKGVEVRG